MRKLEDIRSVVGIPSGSKANTTASGVVDLGDLGYPNLIDFVVTMGDVMNGATSGCKLTVFHSNTVSATASGMTAITSATTSGLTFPNSGTTITLGVDWRQKFRFAGMKLTVPTTSCVVGVNLDCFDHKEVPPTAYANAQQRFIGP